MKGHIRKRVGKKSVSYLLKYDSGVDRITGKRKTHYKTVQGSLKDAQRELRDLLKQVDENSHVDPNKITTGQWLQKWLDDYKKHAVTDKTFRRYKELAAHITGFSDVSDCLIQKLASHQIQSLYTHLRGKKLSERTIHHLHGVLRQALQTAVKQKIIVVNPIEDVDRPKPRPSNVQPLDDEQLRTLLTGLKGNKLFPLVMLASGTGMRLGEMLALRWSCVDMDARTLKVEQTIQETTKPHSLTLKEPKSEKGRRTIALSDNLIRALRTHWKTQAELALKCGINLPATGLIFPAFSLALYLKQRGVDPDALASPRLVSKQFKNAAERLGIKLPPRNSMHVLRHTHATQLLNAQVNPKIVSERLGHSKVATTLDIYAHAMPNMQEAAADVAGTILDKALRD